MPTRCRRAEARRLFPWLVLALSFALLLSDFMCRQVLAAVFPFLKAEWALSDTELGALSSVVALTVGVLTLPLSILADRFGRRRAILGMAVVWSLATLASALAANYGQLLTARVFIGAGEAAYGSVGLAVVLSVFPAHRRASLSGAFTAGGTFGSALGIALGGALAVRYGWRWSVAAMAVIGLVLAVLYRQLITDAKLAAHARPETRRRRRPDRAVAAGHAPVPARPAVRLRRRRTAAVRRRHACSPGCPATCTARYGLLPRRRGRAGRPCCSSAWPSA